MTTKKLFAVVSRHGPEIKLEANFPVVLSDENGRTFKAIVNGFSSYGSLEDKKPLGISGSILIQPISVKNILYSDSILNEILTGEGKTGTFEGNYWPEEKIGRITVSFDENELRLVNWPDVPITSLDELKLGDKFRVNPIACQRKIFGGMGMNWLFEGLSRCVLVVIRRRMEDDPDRMKGSYVDGIKFGFIVDENDRDHPSDRDEIIIPAGENEHWLHESDLLLNPDNCKPKPDEPIPMFVRV